MVLEAARWFAVIEAEPGWVVTPRSTVEPCELVLEDGFDEQAASIAASTIVIKRRLYIV
jgi:hypothetical protein